MANSTHDISGEPSAGRPRRTNAARWLFALPVAAAIAVGGFAGPASAAIITTADIVQIPSGVVGSGNGTLNYLLMTQGTKENAGGGLNLDDATDMPSGNPNPSFEESFVTSGADLKAFYTATFGVPGPGDPEIEMVIFLDLDETGPGRPVNTLDLLDIILNPATINGVVAGTAPYNPVGTDGVNGEVQAADQDVIEQQFTSDAGTSVIAYLDPEPASNLPAPTSGAGFADYAIFTGINPFDLADTDILLFSISMSDLTNGPESIFLSGRVRGIDVCPDPRVQCDPVGIPEPSTLALFGIGLAGIGLVRRRRKSTAA